MGLGLFTSISRVYLAFLGRVQVGLGRVGQQKVGDGQRDGHGDEGEKDDPLPADVGLVDLVIRIF